MPGYSIEASIHFSSKFNLIWPAGGTAFRETVYLSYAWWKKNLCTHLSNKFVEFSASISLPLNDIRHNHLAWLFKHQSGQKDNIIKEGKYSRERMDITFTRTLLAWIWIWIFIGCCRVWCTAVCDSFVRNCLKYICNCTGLRLFGGGFVLDDLSLYFCLYPARSMICISLS